MSRLDELPADQKAVLGLLLRQGRTYGEIAGLLRIDAHRVRERALNALDALGPEPDDRLDGELQDDLSDLLLGQLDDAESLRAREALAASEPGQTWTREVAETLHDAGLGDRVPELEPVPVDEARGGHGAAAAAAVGAAAAALIARAAAGRRDEPDEEPVPADVVPAAAEPSAAVGAPATPGPVAVAEPQPLGVPADADAETDTAEHPAVPAGAGSAPAGPVSRRGGLALITGLTLAAVALVLVLLLRGGSDGDPKPAPAAAATTTTTSTATTTAAADLRTEAQVNLTAPAKGSKAAAVAFVVTRGGQRLLGITGEKFPPTRRKFSYAVWLYNSPTDAERLGYDQRGVGPSGKLQTGADPSQIVVDPQQSPTEQAASKAAKTRLEGLLKRFYTYKRLVITRETTETNRPGPIVVAGDITAPKGE